MNDYQHEEESSRLLDDFQEWLGETASAWDAQLALDYKRATGDYRLTLWTHEMVDDLIQGYLPAKAVLLEDEHIYTRPRHSRRERPHSGSELKI